MFRGLLWVFGFEVLVCDLGSVCKRRKAASKVQWLNASVPGQCVNPTNEQRAANQSDDPMLCNSDGEGSLDDAVIRWPVWQKGVSAMLSTLRASRNTIPPGSNKGLKPVQDQNIAQRPAS